MKVAFDVKGTIEGPRQADILKIFKVLQEAGHEMFVWSNCYSYAVDAIKKYNLQAKPLEKYGQWQASGEMGRDFMDLAIEDDTSQKWLAAHHIVFVHQIPQDLGASFARGLLKDLTLYKNSTD